MRHFVLTTVLLIASGCGNPVEDLHIGTFEGVWEVDFDRTMEEAKKSPKYDEKMAARMPEMVKRMMARMKIKLTGSELIYLRGEKEMVLSYAVTVSNADSITVTVKSGTEGATVIFTHIEGKFMSLKSSVSDDLDYYVWKKRV